MLRAAVPPRAVSPCTRWLALHHARVHRRAISYTYGRNERDPYQTITEQPEEVTTALAKELETRGAHTAQRDLRTSLLCDLSGAVLEVGTGTGIIAREVARLPAVKSVVGVDPSELFLERARKLGGPKERYEVGVSTAVGGSVADGSIDHAIMWTTLVHIPEADHAATFAELRRCLKPGGTLHIFDLDASGWDFRTREHDPLAPPVAAWLEALLPDKYTMRRLPKALTRGGFAPSPLQLTTILDTERDSYGFFFVKRAIGHFVDAQVCGAPLVEAMQVEVERRVSAGEFQMAHSYAHLRAKRVA